MGSFTFIIVATALLAVTGAQNLEGSVTDLQANMTALWAAVAELATCKVPVDIHLHITPGSHEVTVDDEHSDVIPGVMVHTSPDAATSGAADDCSEVTGKRAKKKCKRMNSRRRHHDGSGPARTADAGGPPAPRVGDGWIHAACHMEPNSALQGSEPQIHGHLHLMQTPGEDLMIHMSLSGFGTAAGHRHGFHVHKYGDTHEGCTSAGPHFGHATATHGGPTDAIRHLGDLGNIECDAEGNVRTTLHDSQAKIYGPMSILGRAIVVHAAEDDLGKGGDVGSKSTGNAGNRLACCVIVHTDPTVQGVIPPHHDDDGDYASDSGMAHASHGWFW